MATPETLGQVITLREDQYVTPLPPVDNQALVQEMASLQLRGIRWPKK